MKKTSQRISILFLLLTCCGDVEHEMHEFKLYEFSEGTILNFESGTSVEQFEVSRIVNGRYEDSRSGTCGKPRLDIYYFQAVHLRPVDTLDVNRRFLSTLYTDCSTFPTQFGLRDTGLITSFVSSFDPVNRDEIQWLNEIRVPISAFTRQYARLTLATRAFTNVYEYDVTEGVRLQKVFYNMRHGFIGYQLKDGTMFELTNKIP